MSVMCNNTKLYNLKDVDLHLKKIKLIKEVIKKLNIICYFKSWSLKGLLTTLEYNKLKQNNDLKLK